MQKTEVIKKKIEFVEDDNGKVIRIVKIKKKRTIRKQTKKNAIDYLPESIQRQMEITEEEVKAFEQILREKELLTATMKTTEKIIDEEKVKELTEKEKIDYYMNKLYGEEK